MKILIITDAWHPQVNGVVRTYEHLYEQMCARGHDVKIIGPEDFKYAIPTPGYREIKFVLFPRRKLRQMVEDFDPDRIHLATEGPLGWAGQAICIEKNFHFTTSYHTHFPDYIAARLARPGTQRYKIIHRLILAMIKSFHNRADGIFVATKSLAKTLSCWGFKTPMLPLTRGADLDIFAPDGPKALPDLPGPVALYVGRIAIEKNLEAFLKMDWTGSKLLVGEGPSMAELEAAYPDAHFVGNQTGKELAAHYRSADLFVFPSRTDTFGIVLVEALASGLPVAAYPVTGPIDIITSPELGILDEDLASAAHQALQHGTAQQRHHHAQTNYSWSKVTDQFLRGLEKDPI